MSAVLLPCPFCGGEARGHALPDDEFDNGGGDVIVCSACGASSHVEFGTKENLADAWNRRTTPQATVNTFQQRVDPWMQACFGSEISADRLERADRLLEEVLELLQSGDYPRERIAALTGYVWDRPAGEPAQEVGGVMVTLAAYCLAHGLDMHSAAETELARIWSKVEKIRAKQAAKPTGSALPQAWPALTPQPDAGLDDLLERLDAGVVASGLHEDNSTEMYLVDDATDAMAEAAAALRARPVGEVKVKPLVWEADEDDPDCRNAGDYDIYHEQHGYQVYFWSVVLGEPWEALADAEAAAWAHHDARIRSQIEDHAANDARIRAALEGGFA